MVDASQFYSSYFIKPLWFGVKNPLENGEGRVSIVQVREEFKLGTRSVYSTAFCSRVNAFQKQTSGKKGVEESQLDFLNCQERWAYNQKMISFLQEKARPACKHIVTHKFLDM